MLRPEDMFESFVITAKAENVLRTLQRLASFMTRNRMQIQEMKVLQHSFTEAPNLMITLQTDGKSIVRLVKQLRKLIDLSDVKLKLNKPEDAPCFWGVPVPGLTEKEVRDLYTSFSVLY